MVHECQAQELGKHYGEILVNANAERFVREDHQSVHHLERAILQQAAHQHWTIFDTDILETADPIIPSWSREHLANEQKSSMFFRGMNLQDLAFRAGLNPLVLTSTVQSFNQNIENGLPDPFGRLHRPLLVGHHFT
tara:strand:+ start:111 stop:518 length:408 start_codon:yes stop_codon:yes gene_type:complete